MCNEKKIIRVFPRKTKLTPEDDMVRFDRPSLLDEVMPIDEVHISVSFLSDRKKADELYNAWKYIAETKIGGPAVGMRGEEFIPGMYLKKGCVITSRGCPNKCWFCQVWRRDGHEVRELSIIHDGYYLQDDNLLACSDEHIKKVFAMFKRQKEPIRMNGGMEAKRLKAWHVELLKELNIEQMFFAYDTPDDLEPLIEAGKLLLPYGFGIKRQNLRAFMLCGFPKDTIEDAEKRIDETIKAGFIPYLMLYNDDKGNIYRKNDNSWKKLLDEYFPMALFKVYYRYWNGEKKKNKKIIVCKDVLFDVNGGGY